MDVIRQGDIPVFLVPVKVPRGSKQEEPKNGKLVVAEGEVTGHLHAIDVKKFPSATLFIGKDNRMFFGSTEPVEMTHDEHGTVTIPAPPPGKVWEIKRQREYFPEEIKPVAD